MTLLASVSSHTLLNVLLDMNEDNADGSLIIEVLLERLAMRHADNGVSAPS